MKHLSVTQLLTYALCSRQYYFHYIEKIEKPITSPHLIYGTCIHNALEKLNKSHPMTLSKDDFIEEFKRSWNFNLSNNDIDFKKNKPDNMLTMGINSLEAYYETYKDFIPIRYHLDGTYHTASEMEFKIPIELPDKTIDDSFYLLGVIDVIFKKDGRIILVDYKTSKSKYDEFKIKTNIQLTLYADVFRKLLKDGRFPDIKSDKEDSTAFIIFLKDYKKQEANIIMSEKEILESDIHNLSYIIKDVIKGINNEIYIPNYGEHCNWCDYQEECLKFTYK